jgi:predicted MPP superfamily phosphohydrolase
VTLVGVACSHQQELDATRLTVALEGVPADAFTLLLYHSPDLILEAAGAGVDLYLAGHTHGGQIRLPLYGPMATASRYGKRYASGLFREKGTALYVSRGLGFEGGGMPRARFLCRPEVVTLELAGRVH